MNTMRLCVTAMVQVLLAVLTSDVALAQQVPVRAGSAELPRVFLDCETRGCDFDHFRREILFVDWVRDREDSDVHVIVTSQFTGGGGREFTIDIIGRGPRFDSVTDRTSYTSEPTAIDQEIRAGLTKTLTLSLVRFAAGSPSAERIQVIYEPVAAGELIREQPHDPWNFWVFRIGLNGFARGERASSSVAIRGRASADRVTEDWKIRLRAFGSYGEDKFELSDSSIVTSISREFDSSALVVRSLGPHWSAGARLVAVSSTFLNLDMSYGLGPAFEYNVFPYSESTRRIFTFLATLNFNSFNYMEETIFDKTEEFLIEPSLRASLEMVQPWGEVDAALEGSAFLDDLSQNRVTLFGEVSWRLFRGLSLDMFGSVSHIANQRNLAKGEASDEEIFLRRRELQTSFRHFVSIGISYTFGSKFSNIVNPRFN